MQLIQRAKQEARGQEQSILLANGAEADWFSGKGMPCPKCGGNDRFSWRQKVGAFFCRQCFSGGSNPDVVGSLAWLADVDQKEAAKLILKHFGIDPEQPAPKKGKIKYTFKILEFRDKYNPHMAALWSASNDPIVESAISESGARFGSWFSNEVLAFPVWGPKRKKSEFGADNVEPIGYTLYTALQAGSKIRVKRKGGEESFERSITIGKYEQNTPMVGMIGPWEKVAVAEVVLKVEGTTDMLAANSLLPDDWVAISNSSGSKATPPGWFAKFLEGKQVYVIHDADEAGEIGAKKWARAIGKYAKAVFVPQLFDPGSDLRDFLKTKTSEQFIAWLKNSSGEFSLKPDEKESVESEEASDDPVLECLRDLTLDVLYEDEAGKINVYCAATRKSLLFTQLRRIQIEDMLQLCGSRAQTFIALDPGVNQYSMSQVKAAIALQASTRRVGADDIDMKGLGVWPGPGESDVVVCNGTHLSVWDGSELRIHGSPRYESETFLLGRGDWYDHVELADLCQQAKDINFRRKAFGELMRILHQWTWRNPMSSEILAGLIGATMIQTIWQWRPMISILGESNTGKSTLLDFLSTEEEKCIFGLAFRTSDTTKAGIAQSVKTSAPAICIDEWDSHGQREKKSILQALRGSTGGGRSKRGSAHHRSVEFYFRHLVWTAGIYSNIERDADQNRFIELELLNPTEERWNAFRSIPAEEAGELGMRMLASSIVVACSAARRQPLLERVKVPSIANKRIVRNLSVPAAFTAAILELNSDEAESFLVKIANSFDGEESIQTISQHEEILSQILSSNIDLGRGDRRPITNVLASPTDRSGYSSELEAFGVRLIEGNLFVTDVAHVIDNMTNRSIRTTLLRIPGSFRDVRKMNRMTKRGVMIPSEFISDRLGLSFLVENDSEF